MAKKKSAKDKLESKTVADLHELASKKDIEGRSSMDKSELIDALSQQTHKASEKSKDDATIPGYSGSPHEGKGEQPNLGVSPTVVTRDVTPEEPKKDESRHADGTPKTNPTQVSSDKVT